MKSRQIRIIGGDWRGRKLSVIDAAGLRPTPDRIRETLFNWLAAKCRSATVLDCFAGSGVLGLEAMSRGASSLLACERHPQVVDNLRTQVQRLGSDAIEVIAGDVQASIDRFEKTFDIVFIDPPYAQPEIRAQVLLQLEARQCLREASIIYFEWPQSQVFELPSANLNWLKQKKAGQINYAIAEWKVTG